ncbi:MAG: 5,10-methylene tetrahydromethanopterin reductase, partial [Actinomycetota bacterium]
EILGSEVVPVLRKEMANGRPAHVPDAPTHESLKQAATNRGGQPVGAEAGRPQ